MPSFQDGSLFAYAPQVYLQSKSPSQKGRMFAQARRKQKQSQIAIHDDENVLLRTVKRVKSDNQSVDIERWPRRIETNGINLAYAIRKQAKSNLPIPEEDDAEGEEDDLNERIHPGLLHIYQKLPKHLTSLDVGGYENLAWTQKYAPQRSEHALQGGQEALVLRDWLKRLTVSSVDTGKSRPRSKPPPPRKRKKRPRGLTGFIVSSDEEDELAEEESNEDFGNEPRSLIRTSSLRDSKKVANAILVSGPSGCGKTAAIYAAAKELGFDVFEVNAGDRRSGKDILEKVGEMSQTHHVDHSAGDNSTKKDIETGKQSTLLSMFASKPKPLPNTPTPNTELDKRPRPTSMSETVPTPIAKKPKPETAGRQGGLQSFFTPLSQKKVERNNPKPEEIQQTPTSPLKMVLPDRSSPKKTREPFIALADAPKLPTINAFSALKKTPKSQKQSLILIEEVDVRYDEDKPFWSTIATLINESKRPIVMTCNDETLVPSDTLSLHAILRFTPPPEDLAADYLQTVAALEGHLIKPEDARALYRINDHDLRRSLVHMQFWCQMGVGDRMSGLDWLIARWPPGCDLDTTGLKKRVATEKAYKGDLELFPSSDTDEQQLLLDLWEHAVIDVEDPTLGGLAEYANYVSTAAAGKQALLHYDLYLESLSAADAFGGMNTDVGGIMLDPTHPPMHSADIRDHTGHPILEAHEIITHNSICAEIAICCKILAKTWLNNTSRRKYFDKIQKPELMDWVLSRKSKRAVETSNQEIKDALLPISQSKKDILEERHLVPTVIFENSARLSADIAPYVRSIVSAELAIAEQQLRQSNLLSQGGKTKRPRTTRASRSAQGWESRTAARPSKWFTDKLNSVRVLRTGGHNWPRLTAPNAPASSLSAASSSQEDSS